ncbi:DUF4245 domain-containing protein [Pseudarthrobacter sp. J1738]|uniref:DUF4245 domain-containing protein n=1 Tax=Pseudarthrobacter sp. J1738 TaxID=3420446 RepID=UPI003D277EF3
MPNNEQLLPADPGFKPVLAPGAAKRANASVIGMIIALVVTIAVFVPILLLNASPKSQGYRPTVNVTAIASDAADVAGFTPVAPSLPQGWSPNYARWESAGSSGVATWETGFLSPKEGFVGISQTRQANPTWLLQKTDTAPVTGTRTVGGKDWELRDNGKGTPHMVLNYRGTTVILSGRAKLEEYDVVAAAVVRALEESPAVTGSPSPSVVP